MRARQLRSAGAHLRARVPEPRDEHHLRLIIQRQPAAGAARRQHAAAAQGTRRSLSECAPEHGLVAHALEHREDGQHQPAMRARAREPRARHGGRRTQGGVGCEALCTLLSAPVLAPGAHAVGLAPLQRLEARVGGVDVAEQQPAPRQRVASARPEQRSTTGATAHAHKHAAHGRGEHGSNAVRAPWRVERSGAEVASQATRWRSNRKGTGGMVNCRSTLRQLNGARALRWHTTRKH